MACDHPQFKVSSTVQRHGSTNRIRVQLIVFCTACGKQFEFQGLPIGARGNGAGTSDDRRIAYLAIQPATQGIVLRPFSPSPIGA